MIKEKKIFNEKEILHDAMLTFWEKGFENTSIAELEKSTGIVRTSLYHRYKNKEGVFLAALDLYIENQCASWLEIISSSKPVVNIIEQLFDAIIAQNRSPLTPTGCMVAMNSVEINSLSPAVRKKLHSGYDFIISSLDRLFKHRIETGEIKNEVPSMDIAIYIVGGLQGIMLLSRALNNEINCRPIKEQTLSHIKSLL